MLAVSFERCDNQEDDRSNLEIEDLRSKISISFSFLNLRVLERKIWLDVYENSVGMEKRSYAPSRTGLEVIAEDVFS